MTHAAAQFMASSHASIRAFQELTKTSTQGFEKLLAINLAATQALFDQSLNQFQVATSTRNAQSLLDLQAELLQPGSGKYAAESRHFTLLAADSSAKLTKAFESKLAQAQQGLASLVGA